MTPRNLRPRSLCVRAVVLSVALIAVTAGAAAAAEPADSSAKISASSHDSVGLERASRIGFDLLILRPLNLATTALSLAGAIVAYPVAWPFDGQGHVVDYLVRDPIDRTFRQPLGAL